ncbi:MAG: hypothetical protein R3C59_21545 [Planctomycetaceae bacterium]
MPLHRWSDRNESLNALGLAIRQGTHGQIRDLSIDLTDDDCIVVRGDSRSYYGVQLAIHATQQFGASHPSLPETRLLVRVDGSTLELVVLRGTSDESRESPSTHDADRRPQLTAAAIA